MKIQELFNCYKQQIFDPENVSNIFAESNIIHGRNNIQYRTN